MGLHIEGVGKGVVELYCSTPERDGFEFVKHRVPETSASKRAANSLWSGSHPALYRRFRWPRRRRSQAREASPGVGVDGAVEEGPPLPYVADESPQ